ncbi:MAG: sodium:solute symporter [Planctomycetota bacterium]|nr:MAG: sodium:solute symporter [Planctomycetota bacterium]
MNMHGIDWLIIAAMLVCLLAIAYKGKKHTKSVADFLAAGRCAGRYLLAVSEGMVHLGAITLVALFEMFYKIGFAGVWWRWVNVPVVFFALLSGWVVYRYRATRSFTLAQFFEKRYSKSFRVFSGLISFGSGILNFGVFPGIGAKFIMYLCGFPTTFAVYGLAVPTFAVIMFILLAISLLLTLWGGQIAVMITDFFQGSFASISFVIIMGYLFYTIDWSFVGEAITQRPAGESLVDPFDFHKVENFNIWYFLIASVGIVYNWMGWQSTQAYNASGKSAHEVRMGKVVSMYSGAPREHFFLVIPIIALTVMMHPNFGGIASEVNAILNTMQSSHAQDQMITPVVLSVILPKGLLGLFVAVVIAAFVSTHDSCLHSWGTIFVQDVIMPFRKKPFSPQAHMKVLRISIIAMAIFAFCFSLFFNVAQHLLLWFAVTGAIFLGGSGAAIIGGLYWKRGTTSAAFSAMIVGGLLSVTGVVVTQTVENPIINGQWFYLIAMVAASVIYVVVSLLSKKEPANMDQMLHRGKYAVASDSQIVESDASLSKLERLLAVTKEFTLIDKIIYYSTVIYGLAYTIVFVVGTLYALIFGISSGAWLGFWYYYTMGMFCFGAACAIWFAIGGTRDTFRLFRDIEKNKRNDLDDGMVVGHKDLADVSSEPEE